MTAEPPESPVIRGPPSLEVRWIFPGQLEPAVAGWLERFPAESQSREDTYLVDPQLRGLSVKVRGGVALEVKVYCGSPGILNLAGRARGRMESWQKWSFPVSPLGQEPRCAVELTEIFTPGQDWWTLGFEATGPEDALPGALEATAALVFAQAMPGSDQPGPDESGSYIDWLRRGPGAECYVGT